MNQHTPNERQHYIKLLEGFDFRPPKGCKIVIPFETEKDVWHAVFSKAEHQGDFKLWKFNLHYTEENVPENTDIDSDLTLIEPPKEMFGSNYNLFISVVSYFVMYCGDFDDIAFMKDLWTQLSKIKNESL